MSTILGDPRPQRGLWAPGAYTCWCTVCTKSFIGDKRAHHCADCAYAPQPALLAICSACHPSQPPDPDCHICGTSLGVHTEKVMDMVGNCYGWERQTVADLILLARKDEREQAARRLEELGERWHAKYREENAHLPPGSPPPYMTCAPYLIDLRVLASELKNAI